MSDLELDLSGARLAVTWRSTGTHQVLAAYDDRTLWVWDLATVGPGSDLVGSFQTEVPEGSWSGVVELAAVVDELVSTGPTPRAGDLVLRVGSGAVSGWLALGSEAAARVGTTTQPLLGLARQHPVAAARLTTMVATAPTGQRLAGFSLASVGREPVSLLIDPAALVLTVDGEAELLPAPRMGLVSGDGTLLDGLYQPARIEPGQNAACSVLVDAAAGAGDGAAVSGGVRGLLTMVGPWPVAPTLPFEATTAPS